MARKRVLNALNVLWETLLYAEEGPPVSEVTGIVGEDVLEELNIKVHDLEIDSFGRVSMTIKDPPFLFEILPEAELRKHPLPEEMKPFPEYLKPSERPEDTVDYYWEPEIRAFQVSQYINYFALKPFRKNLGSCSDLAEYRNLSSIKFPDPLLLGAGLDGHRGWFWKTPLIIEAQKKNGYPTMPHITMTAITSRIGQDGCIFYEELAPLVAAMRNRANQPEVSPEEWESLFELEEEELPDKRVFRNEKIFPVLMLSFLGPQHARVFYARMNGKELIIGQSKLYSFERKNVANIELFARLLLSTPISLEEWQRISEIQQTLKEG
ncbi:hypothetical protein DTO166G4_6874 [Paecilomyces variotii]|nr:hypothetical protein DTO164E3_2254 [Paecilomyces variotii]KAJ9205651.1 hypothetical protein DTO032I3_2207 [Paecilomyces variotii]KAJ9211594.1 hypothetical protein DTO166G4_6874 [Paecilomyces variotii]KAJ9225806.1 hypothetical protein DTO169C6_1869 [Paecilomyces variotii]KAJ9232914.1 hypothetical protein DTO166G5_5926 [Paecilomyces variotii]